MKGKIDKLTNETWHGKIGQKLGRDGAMKIKAEYIIASVLLLIAGLVTGCAGTSPTTSAPNPTPSVPALNPSSSSSPYRADISGHIISPKVIIADSKLWIAGNETDKNVEFWVIQISIKNNQYQSPVSSNPRNEWTLVNQANDIDSHRFPIQEFYLSDTIVSLGQSGEINLCFEVPNGAKPSDWQISYKRETTIYSLGQLVGDGTKVEIYDWDLQRTVDSYAAISDEKVVPLKLIKVFNGDNNKIVDFVADKSPVIVWWGTNVTSQIQSSFDLTYQGDAYQNSYGTDYWMSEVQFVKTNSRALKGAGRYRLRIQSSGCSWWVKVGVEY